MCTCSGCGRRSRSTPSIRRSSSPSGASATRPARPERVGTMNWLVRRWRQSLELRIVTTTLVVSAIVVALLGLVVLDQVKRGLIDAKTRVALAETTAGVRSAEAQFQATDRATAGETTSVLLGLAPTGGATLFRSIVLPDPNSQTPQSTGFGGSCSNECEASIPASLKSYVTDSGKEGYVYTRIRN